MDIQKLKRNIKLDLGQVKLIFLNDKTNKGYFITSLNKIISKYQYDGVNFKFDENEGVWDFYNRRPKWGVWQNINGEWKWSYINTIETNQSAILVLLDFYNDLIKKGRITGELLTYHSLSNFFNESCDRLMDFIDKSFDRVFGLYESTELSRKLSVATAQTWYGSIFSELSYVRYVIKDKPYETLYGKDRGDGDDYNKGVDFIIKKDGIEYTYQHKRCNDNKDYVQRVVLDDENDTVIIPIEINKRKHSTINYLIVENNGTIYEFNIDGINEDETIIVEGSQTIIPNERLENVYDKVIDENTEILMSIFYRCIKLEYSFEIFDSYEPYVQFNKEKKEVLIGFNNVDLESIEKELRTCLKELLNTFD
jgi:hypothetical protein